MNCHPRKLDITQKCPPNTYLLNFLRMCWRMLNKLEILLKRKNLHKITDKKKKISDKKTYS